MPRATQYDDVLPFLTTNCSTFFDNVTKAKTAKAVRRVLDIVEEEAPEEVSGVSTPRSFLFAAAT